MFAIVGGLVTWDWAVHCVEFLVKSLTLTRTVHLSTLRLHTAKGEAYPYFSNSAMD